jgi:hypothetical protein
MNTKYSIHIEEEEQEEMDESTIEKIESMTRALSVLVYVSKENQDSNYADIVSTIKEYIATHCCHEKVYDSIDIHPEESKTICYCMYCNTTFP